VPTNVRLLDIAKQNRKEMQLRPYSVTFVDMPSFEQSMGYEEAVDLEPAASPSFLTAVPELMQAYPVKDRLYMFRPHFDNPDVQQVLLRDMNICTMALLGEPFMAFDLPKNFEHYFACTYKFFEAAEFMVNTNMTVLSLVQPNKQWRIVTSELHSTVWDGAEEVFDPCEEYFGSACDCFVRAGCQLESRVLAPGELLNPGLPNPKYLSFAR
jgi:hypothetical protein